nr:uncharacterized protein LOC123773576 [Procambarus clarkii]
MSVGLATKVMSLWCLVVGMVVVLTEATTAPPGANGQAVEWLVYTLSSGGGKGDKVTRMVLSLTEVLGPEAASASLANFTLCLWFRVSTFLEFSTVVSYAISNESSDSIFIRLEPHRLRLRYLEQELAVAGTHSLIPLWWHWLCLVVEPGAWQVWLNGEGERKSAMNSPLPLNGSMVLGQDQDILDGGYTKEQSFLGQLTGLNLWDAVLTPQELSVWAACGGLQVGALLQWSSLKWKVHNETGDVMLRRERPCESLNHIEDSLFIFTEKMTWPDAHKFLLTAGLEMAAPRDATEVKAITKLIAMNYDQCTLGVIVDPGTWLGIVLNTTTDKFEDSAGQAFSFNNKTLKVKRKSNKFHMSLSVLGEWNLMSLNVRMCFTGIQRGRRQVFRLHGLCDDDEEKASFTEISKSFVLAVSQENGIYFHGYRHLHILRDANGSRWCLREGHFDEVACITSELPPLGRHEWLLRKRATDASEADAAIRIDLALSRCTDNQYTCPDATCVNLAKMCDSEFDCSDRSDEVGCTTALLPNSYLLLPPSIPLPIWAEISVWRMTTFDLKSMTFHISLDVKLWWYDPSVTFAHLNSYQTKEVITEKGKEMWQPVFGISNSPDNANTDSSLEVERRGPGKPTSNGYKYPGSENPVVMTTTVKSTVHCDFQLKWYPFDEQTCSVLFTVTNVRSEGLRVNRSSAVRECPKTLEEYLVNGCTLEEELHPTGNITLVLRLSRRYEYHLWTTFLPTSLLLLLGYDYGNSPSK